MESLRTAEVGLTAQPGAEPAAHAADVGAPSPEAREADARPLPTEEEEQQQQQEEGAAAAPQEAGARCPATPLAARGVAPATLGSPPAEQHATPQHARAACTGARAPPSSLRMLQPPPRARAVRALRRSRRPGANAC
jgi:hypothetical protein